jgi:hypothetical protein
LFERSIREFARCLLVSGFLQVGWTQEAATTSLRYTGTSLPR